MIFQKFFGERTGCMDWKLGGWGNSCLTPHQILDVILNVSKYKSAI